MGAWRFVERRFGDALFDRLPLARRSRARTSASPATGSHASHQLEQQSCSTRRSAAAVSVRRRVKSRGDRKRGDDHRAQDSRRRRIDHRSAIISAGSRPRAIASRRTSRSSRSRPTRSTSSCRRPRAGVIGVDRWRRKATRSPVGDVIGTIEEGGRRRRRRQDRRRRARKPQRRRSRRREGSLADKEPADKAKPPDEGAVARRTCQSKEPARRRSHPAKRAAAAQRAVQRKEVAAPRSAPAAGAGRRAAQQPRPDVEGREPPTLPAARRKSCR